jgi:hypothetical protein
MSVVRRMCGLTRDRSRVREHQSQLAFFRSMNRLGPSLKHERDNQALRFLLEGRNYRCS